MYTKYDFPEIFRNKLYQEAKRLVTNNTTQLEKEILEQFKLLTELTNNEWKPTPKYQNVGIFIGAAEGMDNVHEAYFLAKYIEANLKNTKIKFITSGAIGVTAGKSKELGVPGVNAAAMTKLLLEYGVSDKKIITEDKSIHTGAQAIEMSQIIRKGKFDSIICVTDYWHSARLVMTMIGKNPDIDWLTNIVESDKDNIGNALFDFGQRLFQTPLLIAEVARLHKYVEDGVGPCDLDGLCRYLLKFHPHKLSEFIKSKKLTRLKYLWDKTHEDILSNFEKFAKYR